MSNNKQTAVEWLYNHLFPKQLDGFSYDEWDKIDKAFEQAKAMHKQEIKDAVGVGSQFDRDYLYGYHDKAEQYYNEEYGS